MIMNLRSQFLFFNFKKHMDVNNMTLFSQDKQLIMVIQKVNYLYQK